MLNKMSEAQRAMLQGAAAREDRLLLPPGNARGAVTKSLAARLTDAGLAKEIKASNDAPVWRRDGAIGAAYAMKLTAKGLKAVAAAGAGPDGSNTSSLPTAAQMTAPRAAARESAPSVGARVAPTENKANGVALTPAARAPRSGSKLANVLASLSAEGGATIGELSAATGWLEHTTRAALTSLRRRGYTVSLSRREQDSASVYRISSAVAESTP